MKNIRKYNNNIILADDNGLEVIALGKGLGFGVKQGCDVNMSLVEKVFVPQETTQMHRFKDILADLPYEYVILASKIVDYGKARLKQPLNQSIVIALADHLNFAVTRLKESIDIQMPLSRDIQHIYPEEFIIGEEALEIITQEIDFQLPQTEAAAIALHFVNAESKSSDMQITLKVTTITKEVIAIIEKYFSIVFDENSFAFMRFVTHLRNVILHYLVSDFKDESKDDGLYDLVKERYKKAFSCCEQIAKYFLKTQGWKISHNDLSFLVLHIHRLSEIFLN
jgi:beta-glucoside operon transcriptional antiterminator